MRSAVTVTLFIMLLKYKLRIYFKSRNVLFCGWFHVLLMIMKGSVEEMT